MKEIKLFLKDPDRNQIVIRYSGKRLNVACDWAKFRSPLLMFLRAFLNEILRKFPPCSLKNHLYRLMGVKIGRDIAICPDVSLDPLFPELITIEEGVTLGWGCKIFTHEFTADKIKLGRVVVREKALMGGYSVIGAGVTIGKNSIVSLCSAVNKSVEDGDIVCGIPARKIKEKTAIKGEDNG